MKAATLSELKKEMGTLSVSKLKEVCLRLAKYKKENKELLTYLLFESENEQAYVEGVKQEVNTMFSEMNKSNLYLAKKNLRKILRTTNKYGKYSGKAETEAELLIYFLGKLKKSGIPVQDSVVLTNLVNQQLKKIEKVLSTLHEDLQYDFRKELGRYHG